MAELRLDECCDPLPFNPLDYDADGGNMVLWNATKGGTFPWDRRYYQETPDTSSGFDPEYIMRHASDSAATAGTLATGRKAATSMMSQTLYEEDSRTLVEDALYCDMAAGVVTSVDMFHATPGSFISHANDRYNIDQINRSFERVNPTLASGVCKGELYPRQETLDRMRHGSLSSMWTLLEQDNVTLAEVKLL